MPPDATWPNVADPLNITEADHVAHTTRRGVHYPEDAGLDPHKLGKQLLKFVNKRHSRPTRKKKHA